MGGGSFRPNVIKVWRGSHDSTPRERLPDITTNNNAIPGDWKKAIVFPIYKGGDRSVVGNYRPFSLKSVVCKQTEQDIAECQRHV